MRILMMIHRLADNSPYCFYVHEQAKALREQGHDVTVISCVGTMPMMKRLRPALAQTDKRTPKADVIDGIPVYFPRCLTLGNAGEKLLGGYPMYRAALPIARKLHDEKPFDVIHAHMLPREGHAGRLLGRALGLSDAAFGLWAGTAVNDTSSVTAAAAAWDGMHPGANTLDTAAIVKMTRTLAIIPITLVLALLRTRREGKQGGAQVDIKKIFPWFVLLFLVASIITTVLPIPGAVTGFLKNASKFFIVMAMAAIGLNTDIVKLVKSGGKPIFMGLCCWVAIALVSLGVQHLLGIW